MSEWKTTTIGEITDSQLGKMLNKSRQTGKHLKPYLRTDNVHWGKFDLSELKEMDIYPDEESKYLATKGDLLMCEGGASGRSAIWYEDFDIGFQNHIHRIRPKDDSEISVYFLRHFFEWFILNGHASSLIKGVTINSLSQSALRSIPIKYPSFNEQIKIVEILEEHLSRIDSALEDVKQAREKADQFRRSLLHVIFEEWSMPESIKVGFSNTELESAKVPLNSVARVISGKTPKGISTIVGEIQSEPTDIPFYKVGDMNLNPTYLQETRTWMSSSQIETMNLEILPSGSIVFPKAGGAIATNKKRIIKIPGAIDLNCMAVLPGNTLNFKFLYYWFESIDLINFSNGSILPQISKSVIESTAIPVPSIAIQEKIIQFLDDEFSTLSSSLALLEFVSEQGERFRRSLLQAAFTGQLTKEDANV